MKRKMVILVSLLCFLMVTILSFPILAAEGITAAEEEEGEGIKEKVEKIETAKRALQAMRKNKESIDQKSDPGKMDRRLTTATESY